MKIVTELDFRMPEFKDADPNDYEFRDDGKIVRKDRWEQGIRNIAGILKFDIREGFEVEDVINCVQYLKGTSNPMLKILKIVYSDKEGEGLHHNFKITSPLSTFDDTLIVHVSLDSVNELLEAD